MACGSRRSNAKTRSICPENPTGGKGEAALATEGTGAHAARDLGRGWKMIPPSIRIEPGEIRVLADIDGQGAIQHIWMTPTGNWRFSILRVYWDDSDVPAVECPVGDFFGSGWGEFAQLSSWDKNHCMTDCRVLFAPETATDPCPQWATS